MPIQQPIQNSDEPAAFLPRQLEMQHFAALLPLREVTAHSKRVFNVWGEHAVGKSTFLSEFRENPDLARSKILWIQPTRKESLDTIPEFILACSKSIRFPAAPEKERKIADLLESVHRGKVNPILSDDSILITRSELAKKKKPYVNQAAAASVGRTMDEREDIEISVGLGETKASNHAEAFLDILPLQSLGCDLIVLYIEKAERLSQTVRDWLRDYVIPAATRGPYRRNLIFIVESLDPIKLEDPSLRWGEWENALCEFRLYPLSSDDTYQCALRSGLDEKLARFVSRNSLGYPGLMQTTIEAAQSGELSGKERDIALSYLKDLPKEERLKLGGLCLPHELRSDELDVLFGKDQGKLALAWLSKLPGSPLSQSSADRVFTLPDNFRAAILGELSEAADFKAIRSQWAPMGRLRFNVPAKSDRNNLLLFAKLKWVDKSFCQELFGAKGEKVFEFIEASPRFFNRHGDLYRVSPRISDDLETIAASLEHLGATSILAKAADLWDRRKSSIQAEISQLEAQLAAGQEEVNQIARRLSETSANLRIQERKIGETSLDERMLAEARRRSNAPILALFVLLAVTGFTASAQAQGALSTTGLVGGIAATLVSLGLLPRWLFHLKAVAASRRALREDSPEHLRKTGLELNATLQEKESDQDQLKHKLEETTRLLDFPYV